MKKILSIILACSAILAFSGCGNNSENSATTPDETASAVEESVQQTDDNKADLQALHSYDAENGNIFAGAWTITEGEGSQYKSFVYLFDGNDSASIIIDTMGYVGEYSLTTEDEKEIFSAQLMFGINGNYTYKVSDDKNTITLTNTETDVDTTLQRVVSFDCIPIPDENAKIDSKILGAWKTEDGDYYYFDESGIMYNNSYGTIFTYYTYSAENSQITATYSMGEETTETFEYSVNGDTMTIDGFTYNKIPANELI